MEKELIKRIKTRFPELVDDIMKEIENEKKPTYKIGQRFVENDSNDEYILAQVDYFKVCLIALNNGNRYVEPVEVNKPYNITEKEFKKITSGDKFTLKQ